MYGLDEFRLGVRVVLRVIWFSKENCGFRRIYDVDFFVFVVFIEVFMSLYVGKTF